MDIETHSLDRRRVNVPCTNLYDVPDENSGLETQLLFGETVVIIGREGLWNRVRADLDGYEGYVLNDHLCNCKDWVEPAFRVAVPRALVFRDASFKSSIVGTLAMNSRVAIEGELATSAGKMVEIRRLGWVFADRFAPISEPAKDFVAEMLRFVGQQGGEATPYGWGNRHLFLDCSSHLQHGLTATGVICPRNVGQQIQAVGEEFHPGGRLLGLKRGDLVFWTNQKGRHVVAMIDSKQAVHSTIAAPYRGSVVQPLADIIADQQRDGNGLPTQFRRMPEYTF